MVFHSKKKGRLSEGEKKVEDLGDRWTYVNVLPRSSFIHTVHHGKRNGKQTLKFVEKIKDNSNGKAPTFLSDGYEEYEKAIKTVYDFFDEERMEFVLPQELNYAQIVKHKKNGKLESIEEKIIFGYKEKILEVIREDGRGKKLNTSFVESRNGNYRKDTKRLTRRTQCHSKKRELHDAQIDWITAVFNFCRENTSFRNCCNKDAKPFETKYQKRSPAMVERLTDKILSFEELLMIRVC